VNPAVAPSDANAAFDAFDARPSCAARPIAGQPRQGAVITPVMNGYCVSVSGLGVTPGSGVRGFSVTGTGKKTLNVEDADRTNGTVVAALGPISNASDTKYCAQITAAVGWTRTTLTWDYNGGTGGDGSISVDIQTANITLEHCGGTAFPAKENANEPLGRPAELCTVAETPRPCPTLRRRPSLAATALGQRITSSDWDRALHRCRLLSESAETNAPAPPRGRPDCRRAWEEQCLIRDRFDGIAPFAFPGGGLPYGLQLHHQPCVVTPPLADKPSSFQGVPTLPR
jgi:hypothetical protein